MTSPSARLPEDLDLQTSDRGAGLSLTNSPFEARFDTNHIPTPEELKQLHNIVSIAQSEVDRMNAEISRLEQQISYLQERTLPISLVIEKHRALMNPIRRIPAEIMQEIFIRCLPQDGEPPRSMHRQDFPMVLTLVCKSWREITLGTPILWSKLHFPLTSSHYQAYHDPVYPRSTGIQEWLRRSGSAPLSISIVQLEGRYPEDPRYLHNDIFPLIRPHSHRWKHIHLVMTIEQAAPFLDIEVTDLRCLVSANIHLLYSSPDPYNSTLQDDTYDRFYGSGMLRNPSLRELALSSRKWNSDNIAPSCLLVWENLTTLILDDGNPSGDLNRLFGVLKRALRLEALHLHLSPPYEERPPSMDPSRSNIITLPHLKRLGVVESTPAHDFVRCIRLPSLESLAYSPYMESNQTLATLLEHSGAHIQTLVTPPYVPSTSLLLSYLHHCPRLQTLFLFAGPNMDPSSNAPSPAKSINNEFLRGVLGLSDSSPSGVALVPHLTTIICDRPVAFTPQDLLDFLRVRQFSTTEGVSRLEKLVLQFNDVETPGLYDEGAGMIPGGRANTGLKFGQPTVPASSLKAGLLDPRNKWYYTFSLKDYFSVQSSEC